jgi:hypothetical protein
LPRGRLSSTFVLAATSSTIVIRTLDDVETVLLLFSGIMILDLSQLGPRRVNGDTTIRVQSPELGMVRPVTVNLTRHSYPYLSTGTPGRGNRVPAGKNARAYNT